MKNNAEIKVGAHVDVKAGDYYRGQVLEVKSEWNGLMGREDVTYLILTDRGERRWFSSDCRFHVIG